MRRVPLLLAASPSRCATTGAGAGAAVRQIVKVARERRP